MSVHVVCYQSCALASASGWQARAIRSAAGRLARISACRSIRECLSACLPRITRAHRPARSRSRMPPTRASSCTRSGTRTCLAARRLPRRSPLRQKALKARACITSCAACPQRRAKSGPHFIWKAPLHALTSRVSRPVPAVCKLTAPHWKFDLYNFVSDQCKLPTHTSKLFFFSFFLFFFDDYDKNCWFTKK